MKQDQVFTLSRAEIYYLMQLLGAKTMIGLGVAESVSDVLNIGRDSLVQRGFVTTTSAGAQDKVNDTLLSLVMTSFFPDGALIVARDLPEIGEQVLLFFRRESSMVLHTFPEQFSHRLAPLDGLQAIDLIQHWFPLVAYPSSDGRLLLTIERFEQVRDRAESHQKDAALQLLTDSPLADEEKVNLVEAIEQRTISGSFATMQCAGDTITTAYSLAVIAGPSTAWLISQPENDSQGNHLLIRRVGENFGDLVTGLVQRF